MGKLKQNWIDRLRFKTQLSFLFIVGILLLAFVTSVMVSSLSSSIIEKHEVRQGMQVTESLARRSEIALLYQSAEAAREIAEDAMNFPGVKGIAIETDKADMLYSVGASFSAQNNQLDSDPAMPFQDLVMQRDKRPHALGLVAENNDLWKFTAPILASSSDEAQVLGSEIEEDVLLEIIWRPHLLAP